MWIVPKKTRNLIHDLGTESVQVHNLAKPVANSGSWTQQDSQRTNIAVYALVEKTQQCSMCGSDASRMNCTVGQKAACTVEKIIRCDKICFLIGNVGLKSQGDVAYTQGFTAQECPIRQKMVEKATLSTVNQTLRNKLIGTPPAKFLRVTEDSVLLKNQELDIQPVTLEKVIDTLPNFTNPDEKVELLASMYNSEDQDLQQCCFPACRIPKLVMAGKFYAADNPWYWYDRDSTLSRHAPMQFAYSH